MPTCKACKKKIKSTLVDIYTCRCKHLYCGIHLHNHNCNFDYKTQFKEENRDLVVVGPDRLNYRI